LKKSAVAFIERMFYAPKFPHLFLSLILYPFSLLYCFIVFLKYKFSSEVDFNIPIISVGNLSVGGSGKTPLVTALALHVEKPAIILRGYGRKSTGLYVVKNFNTIECSVEVSGDEAMIYAKKLSHAIVIVSESRSEAIDKAKEMGAKVILLDDAYSKHFIKKLDILIDVNTNNKFCLPAGPFREKLWKGKKVVHVKEELDFIRKTTLIDESETMALVTAIARPERLDSYLPETITKKYYEDHHFFTKDEIIDVIKEYNCTSILMTYKDFVKVESFELPITLLDLYVELKDELVTIIKQYIEDFDVKKN